MLDARAPWWSRTPLFGNLGAPIIRKEVTALVRRNRWFWVQFIYLVVITAGMAIIHVSTAYAGVPVEQVGAALVTGFFTLQLGLVFLIFPGLAATSISSERIEKSFDLLTVSDLSPVEIVWGKLLGILGSAGYFIVSTLPILGVCIFFGGLSPLGIAIDYAFLLLVATVLSSWGILVSSFCSGNVKAIIITYALALILGWLTLIIYVDLAMTTGARGLREAIELVPPAARWAVVGIVGGAIAAFVGGCLVGAVFTLSPPESNRATVVRAYLATLLAAMVGIGALVLFAVAGTWGGAPQHPEREGLVWLWILGITMFVILVALAGSRVETPLAAVRAAAVRPLRTRLAWLFIGGGIRGWALAAVLLALGLGSAVGILDGAIALYSAAATDAELSWEEVPLGEVNRWLAEVLAAWIFAHIGLAFLLATAGVRGALNLFLTIGVALLLLLYSASVLAQAHRGPGRVEEREPPAIISPLLLFAEVEDSGFPPGGPERAPTTTGHWLAGGVFLLAGLATLRARRLPALGLSRPGYEFLSGAGEVPEGPPEDRMSPVSSGKEPG